MQYIIPLLKSNKKRSEKLYAIKMWRRLSRSTGHWDNIACHHTECHSKHIYLWKSPCLIMANTHCLCKHHSTPCCSLSNWHTYIDSKCFLRSHISGTLWLFFVLHNSSYHVPLVRWSGTPVGLLTDCRRCAVWSITGIAFLLNKSAGVFFTLVLCASMGGCAEKKLLVNLFTHLLCGRILTE